MDQGALILPRWSTLTEAVASGGGGGGGGRWCRWGVALWDGRGPVSGDGPRRRHVVRAGGAAPARRAPSRDPLPVPVPKRWAVPFAAIDQPARRARASRGLVPLGLAVVAARKVVELGLDMGASKTVETESYKLGRNRFGWPQRRTMASRATAAHLEETIPVWRAALLHRVGQRLPARRRGQGVRRWPDRRWP